MWSDDSNRLFLYLSQVKGRPAACCDLLRMANPLLHPEILLIPAAYLSVVCLSSTGLSYWSEGRIMVWDGLLEVKLEGLE